MYFNFRKKITKKKVIKSLGSLCAQPVLPCYETLHVVGLKDHSLGCKAC